MGSIIVPPDLYDYVLTSSTSEYDLFVESVITNVIN